MTFQIGVWYKFKMSNAYCKKEFRKEMLFVLDGNPRKVIVLEDDKVGFEALIGEGYKGAHPFSIDDFLIVEPPRRKPRVRFNNYYDSYDVFLRTIRIGNNN